MPERVTLSPGRRRKGHRRVLRGGSWINHAQNLRAAQRNANTPDNRNHNIGLRLAGALVTGGSVNQLMIQLDSSVDDKRNQGPWHVSRHLAESLPPGRTIQSLSP